MQVFHKEWQQTLKFRLEGQHSKCTECEKFKQYIRIAQSAAEKQMIRQNYSQHIQGMLEDRKVDAVLIQRATDYDLLNLTIDSMDCAKWKCPRNLAGTKEFSALWRPECTFTAVLTEGHSENFFLMNQNIVKDSDLMMTLLSRAIHRAVQHLQERNKPTPRMVRVHCDNAPGETKNQHVLRWLGWLVHRGIFEEAHLTSFRVGHSHGAVDERFAAIRLLLADSMELQDPDDFMSKVQKLKGRSGRSVHVEQVHASGAFKQMFAGMQDIALTGHTQSKTHSQANKEAPHCFQLRKRRNALLDPGDPPITEIPGFPPHEDDIILRLSSPEEAQPPLTFVPVSHWATVQSACPEEAPRRAFTEKQVHEFTKTASVVAGQPWGLRRASQYLKDLIADTGAGPMMPNISLALTAPAVAEPVHARAEAITAEDLRFSNRPPTHVAVKAKATAAKSKTRKREVATTDSHRDSAKNRRIETDGPGQDAHANPELPSSEEVDLPPSPGSAAAGPEMAPATGASSTQGCPESMRGRSGAPERIAVPEAPPPAAQPVMKRPAAAKASSQLPKQLGRLPFPDDVNDKLGCPKCNHNRRIGRQRCRKAVGLILNTEKTAWVWANCT